MQSIYVILVSFVFCACTTTLNPSGSTAPEKAQLDRPQKSADQLLTAALTAKPPVETGHFRASELVELVKLEPAIKLDIRYATTNNFEHMAVYSQARAFMQKPAALALIRVHRNLASQGYGLMVHDAYRPWYVTKFFWDDSPEDQKIYVANPDEGSVHNRGCAVDLTLYDLKSGQAVVMPSDYDEGTERSWANYTGGTDEQRRLREVLRHAMEAEGFAVYEFEWWHFDYRDWKEYAIQNSRFEDLDN